MTVGDAGIELDCTGAVHDCAACGVEEGVVLERAHRDLDRIERRACPCPPNHRVLQGRHFILPDTRNSTVYQDEGHCVTLRNTIAYVATFVVSDLHGAADDLTKAVPEGATLILLGDLINFIDYFSMTGILTEVFTFDTVSEVVRLRTAGNIVEAREVIRKRSEGREEEIRTDIGRRVRDQYNRVFAALPEPTYLILGNVDNPDLVRALIAEHPGVIDADGSVIDIEGERFGFVGGALPTPLHVAGEITEEEMRHKVRDLGECDVLCSHIPPAVPELCHDTVAGRAERGSGDLLQYIMEVGPRLAYFGHIHQPLVSSMYVGRTLCINVGYFRSTRRAWRHVLVGRE
jgi:Icc-related predicted phosphoesterase